MKALTRLSLLVLMLCLGIAAVPAAAQTDAGYDQSYTLGAGDKLHIIVFSQEDLTGDFVVDGTGSVQLPLLGQVRAQDCPSPNSKTKSRLRCATANI